MLASPATENSAVNDKDIAGRRFQAPLAVADKDGCGGERTIWNGSDNPRART